tara:strand:+ start:209 stop:451 length:243 start_codon:yes stop_codon:yes gene_type:complete
MTDTLKGIYLQWTDSTGMHGWSTLPDDFDLMLITSIGVLVSENNKSITIASSKDDQENPKYDGMICIPKHAIVKRKFLKL